MTGTVPVVFLCGYLGAGKTTLLNHVIRNEVETRLGVVVNDFGAVNVDREAVAAHRGETVGLSNGCICCTITNSLSDTLLRLVAGAESPQFIVVETSGVARPSNVIPHVRCSRRLHHAATVAVVDAENVETRLADRYVGTLVRDQIAAASVIVVNKSAHLPGTARTRLLNRLSRIALHRPPILIATQETLARITIAELANGVMPPKRTGRADPPQHRFASFVFRATGVIDETRLRAALGALPDWVHRVKGWVALDASETRFC